MRILISSFIGASLFLVLLIEPLTIVDGQSGRKSPPPPAAEPVKPESGFVPDPNRDEYQLIFGAIPEAEQVKGRLDRWDRREYYATNFSDDITRMAAQGYRLVSVSFWPRVAVLRRDDYQYEYVIFQVSSRRQRFPNDPQFGPAYEPWARRGFRVADYMVVNDWCESHISGSNETFDMGTDCTYFSEVVLERRKGVETTPQSYEIVAARPTYSKEKLETVMTEEINYARKMNVYPTHMLTKFQLLAQSPIGADFPDDKYDMEVVSGEVKKRVNALAQLGFRLILRPIWFDAAVMHRKKGTAEPASYVWVTEKKLEQELPGLQEQGAVYKMNYACRTDTPLIFEQPSVKDGKQREYKVLTIELQQLQGTFKDKVKFEISTGSNDHVQEFKRLTKEGFVARDLFGCYLSDKKDKASRVKVLMERVK